MYPSRLDRLDRLFHEFHPLVLFVLFAVPLTISRGRLGRVGTWRFILFLTLAQHRHRLMFECIETDLSVFFSKLEYILFLPLCYNFEGQVQERCECYQKTFFRPHEAFGYGDKNIFKKVHLFNYQVI